METGELFMTSGTLQFFRRSDGLWQCRQNGTSVLTEWLTPPQMSERLAGLLLADKAAESVRKMGK